MVKGGEEVVKRWWRCVCVVEGGGGCGGWRGAGVVGGEVLVWWVERCWCGGWRRAGVMRERCWLVWSLTVFWDVGFHLPDEISANVSRLGVNTTSKL